MDRICRRGCKCLRCRWFDFRDAKLTILSKKDQTVFERILDEDELLISTWILKRMRQMRSALQECESYFEERADAEFFPDSPDPCGNREMRLLVEVQDALNNLPRDLAA